MARQRQVVAAGVVRGMVREGVRRGDSRADIIADVRDRFPSQTARGIGLLVTQETRRQNAVDALRDSDKRRTLDPVRLLGCPPGASSLRMSITIIARDPQTGVTRTYTTTVMTPSTGRTADVLNNAIGQAVDAATQSGSPIPRPTSAQTTGPLSYRINYVDCL